MNCHLCNKPGVHNVVLGKEFYYCRACKVECESVPDTRPMTMSELVEHLNNTPMPIHFTNKVGYGPPSGYYYSPQMAPADPSSPFTIDPSDPYLNGDDDDDLQLELFD